ncbi:hypothetical protein DsansV1_C01g0005781 [Dioscorea sansibarensis]
MYAVSPCSPLPQHTQLSYRGHIGSRGSRLSLSCSFAWWGLAARLEVVKSLITREGRLGARQLTNSLAGVVE